MSARWCIVVWVALAACGGDAATPADAGDSAVETVDAADVALDVASGPDEADQGALRFDPAAVRAADFFAAPYPSDLRRTGSGQPDLAAFRRDLVLLDLLAPAIAEVQAGPSGFSPLTPVYFGFAVDIDPATLPADADASLAPDASVQLIDVTPGSPTWLQRAPIAVWWQAEERDYWPARTLALQPDYQQPLRPATTYAAIVTTAVRGAGGEALTPPAVLRELDRALARPGGPTPLAASLAPLAAALPALRARDPAAPGAGELLAATVFTTSDPMAELRQLSAWLTDELPAATPSEVHFVGHRDGFDLYEGTFASVELFSGEAPYTDFGQGVIALDADGHPTAQTPVELVFALSLPTTAPPAAGYPVVLYGHGLGEDHRGFLRTAAAPLAARGIACIGLDPPLQGARNTSGLADRDLIVQLSLTNIVIGREILRQGVLDLVRALDLVTAPLVIPADVAQGGAALPLDPTRVGFFGHSEGAQVGALLLPLTPGVGPAVFSEGGGGAAITLVDLHLPELDVAPTVARALGADPAGFDVGHPLVGVVIQPLLDVADPLHCARQVLREPVGTDRPHDLVMLEGLLDPLTPPRSIEALASALGLPVAEPVAQPIAGLARQGVPAVALPAASNLPPVNGFAPTGALLQVPEGDHYMIYFDDALRTRLFDFLASALAGAARLDAPR